MENRIIAVCSGKGGVGKTTAAASLGMALARMDRDVLLVDLDLGLRNLDVVLGMETRVFYHLEDVLRGKCSAEEAMVVSESCPKLRLLPAVQNMSGRKVTAEEVKALLKTLSEQFAFILIDCPAGIGEYFRTAAGAANECLVVTNPVISAVRDADKVLHLTEEQGIRKRSVLVNGIRPELVRKGYMMQAEDIADILGAQLLGMVGDEAEVIRLTNEGQSLIGSGTEAGKAYERIARRLCGEEVPFPKKKKRKGWFR